MKKIVVTGPESTGKSKLIHTVAQELGIPYSVEFARQYLSDINRPYTFPDLYQIACGQLANNRFKGENGVVLCDTDLITIKIWSQFKYNKLDPRIATMLHQNLPDYYLLCDIDIPWQPDPLRENPNERDILKTLYINEIIATKVPFTLLSGSIEKRKEAAIRIIQSF